MSQTPELDPATIRRALVTLRNAGRPFDQAWAAATNHHRATSDERSVYRFMKAAFRAAYHNDQSGKGRCLVPERDVSGAIVRGILRPAPSPDHDRCRSGDGCDHVATCGRFGKTFCARHGAELARLAVKLSDDRSRRNPQRHGNPSIVGTRGTES